jgi:hypothetical protein
VLLRVRRRGRLRSPRGPRPGSFLLRRKRRSLLRLRLVLLQLWHPGRLRHPRWPRPGPRRLRSKRRGLLRFRLLLLRLWHRRRLRRPAAAAPRPLLVGPKPQSPPSLHLLQPQSPRLLQAGPTRPAACSPAVSHVRQQGEPSAQRPTRKRRAEQVQVLQASRQR